MSPDSELSFIHSFIPFVVIVDVKKTRKSFIYGILDEPELVVRRTENYIPETPGFEWILPSPEENAIWFLLFLNDSLLPVHNQLKQQICMFLHICKYISIWYL